MTENIKDEKTHYFKQIDSAPFGSFRNRIMLSTKSFSLMLSDFILGYKNVIETQLLLG